MPSVVWQPLRRRHESTPELCSRDDLAIDVATARAAGVAVWALPYGYNMGKPIQDSSPDRVIQDFSALRSVFGETPPAG